MPVTLIGPLFLLIALVFAILSIRDYRRAGGTPTPARRAWVRIAVIFAAVGVWLTVMHG
jgi:amino acid transporter